MWGSKRAGDASPGHRSRVWRRTPAANPCKVDTFRDPVVRCRVFQVENVGSVTDARGEHGNADRRTGRRRSDDSRPQGQDDAGRRRRTAQGQDQLPDSAGTQATAAQSRGRALHRQRGPRRNRAHLHHRQPAGRKAQAAQPDEADSGFAGDHETADRVRDLRLRAGGAQQLPVSPTPTRTARHATNSRMAQSTLPSIEPRAAASQMSRLPARSLPVGLLVSLRPSQWTKNLIVFAGLLFGVRLFDVHAIARACAAFAVFCALSGVVYLINDIADREADRRHPIKRTRPIASGQVPIPAALTLAGVLALTALGAALWLRPQFG